MNEVPFLFVDTVCHQLRLASFDQVIDLSGIWSNVGAVHCVKRREMHFSCSVEGEEAAYHLEKRDRSDFSGKVSDLDSKYDRITHVLFEWRDYRATRVSVDELQSIVLPSVASLVTDNYWRRPPPLRSARNTIFYNAFKNCPGFGGISLQDRSQYETAVDSSSDDQNGEKTPVNEEGEWFEEMQRLFADLATRPAAVAEPSEPLCDEINEIEQAADSTYPGMRGHFDFVLEMRRELKELARIAADTNADDVCV